MNMKERVTVGLLVFDSIFVFFPSLHSQGNHHFCMRIPSTLHFLLPLHIIFLSLSLHIYSHIYPSLISSTKAIQSASQPFYVYIYSTMRKPADSLAMVKDQKVNMNNNNNTTINKVRKGLWSPEEDEKLMNYMVSNGQGCWTDVARNAGLQRCGKSCRLRWINYLRPDLKRGAFSPQEEQLIIHLHSLLGNRYSLSHTDQMAFLPVLSI